MTTPPPTPKPQPDGGDLIRRAYRLYLRYQTTTAEYEQIAEGLGLSTLELNVRLHPLYVERKFRVTRTA